MHLFRTALLVTVLGIAGPVAAQTATLDPSFDGDGIAVLSGLLVDPEVCCAAPTEGGWLIAGDAKLIVGPRQSREPFVVKLRQNGTLDASFGFLGISLPSVSDRVGDGSVGYKIKVRDLHVDPDGRILLAGNTEFAGSYVGIGAGFVLRLGVNGVLDTAFDGGVVWQQYAPDDPALNVGPNYFRSPLFTVGSSGKGPSLHYAAFGHQSRITDFQNIYDSSWGTYFDIRDAQTAAPASRTLQTREGTSLQGMGQSSWRGDGIEVLIVGNHEPRLAATPLFYFGASHVAGDQTVGHYNHDSQYIHWAARPDRSFYAALPDHSDDRICWLRPRRQSGEYVYEIAECPELGQEVRSLATDAHGALWRVQGYTTATLVGPDASEHDSFAVPYENHTNDRGRIAQAIGTGASGALNLVGWEANGNLHFRQHRLGAPIVPALDTLPAAWSNQTVNGVARGAWVVSAPFQVLGIDNSSDPETGLRVPASVDVGELRVNGGDWETGIAMVLYGDRIEVRHRASAAPATATHSVLTVGGALGARTRQHVIGERRSANFTSVTDTSNVPSANNCTHSGASNCPGPIPESFFTALQSSRLLFGCDLVTSIQVAVEIQHPRIADLQVSLQTPGAGTLHLLDGADLATCGADLSVRFEEAGTTPPALLCGNGVPALSGSIRPKQTLHAALGTLGTGSWTLLVNDRVTGQTGTLEDWSLTLGCHSNVDPPLLTDLTVAETATLPVALSAGELFNVLVPISRKTLANRSLPAVGAEVEFFAPAASLPLAAGVSSGLIDLSWQCTLEGGVGGGAACPLPSHCSAWPCTQRPIAVTAALAEDQELLFDIDARLGPAYDAASLVVTQAAQGLFDWDTLTLAPLERDPRDNTIRQNLALANRADLRLGSASVGGSDDAPWIDLAIHNDGPADSGWRRLQLTPPAGYSFQSFVCVPGAEAECPPVSGTQNFFRVQLNGVARLRALLQRSGGNGGTVQVQLVAPILDGGPADPTPANDSQNVVLPAPPLSGTIFSNSFE